MPLATRSRRIRTAEFSKTDAVFGRRVKKPPTRARGLRLLRIVVSVSRPKALLVEAQGLSYTPPSRAARAGWRKRAAVVSSRLEAGEAPFPRLHEGPGELAARQIE